MWHIVMGQALAKSLLHRGICPRVTHGLANEAVRAFRSWQSSNLTKRFPDIPDKVPA